MHEMSLAEGVLQIVEDAARGSGDGGFLRVKTVFIEIGQLSSVEPDSMRFCFDAVTRGSLAEGAALVIDELPGAAWCFGCNEAVPIVARGDACPGCGGARLQVTAGTEMRVKDIRGN